MKYLSVGLLILFFGIFMVYQKSSENKPETKGVSTTALDTELLTGEINDPFIKIVDAVRVNDYAALYALTSPRVQNIYTKEKFTTLIKGAEYGVVRGVKINTWPKIKIGDDWAAGKWADGVIEVDGNKGEQLVVIRMVKEEDGWWMSEIIPISDK